MRVLLDTHTFLWFISDSPKLSSTVKEIIEDEDNEKLLSIISIWEMAIKQSIGKLNVGNPFKEFIEQQISVNSTNILNINIEHINTIFELPLHHRDPFDRLLIAQAMVEKIPIISADTAFDTYSITKLW